MPRRFVRLLAAVSAAAAFAAFGAAPANAATVEVQRIVPAQPSGATPDQIGVLVFFDFSPASRDLLTRVQKWAGNAASNVVLEREPLADASPAPLVRAFVVAHTLGIADPVLPGLFALGGKALDADRQQKALPGVFKRWGIDGLEFNAAWNSAAADAGVTRARALAARFDVSRAPTIVINGIWRLVPSEPAATAALMAALERQVATVASAEARNQ